MVRGPGQLFSQRDPNPDLGPDPEMPHNDDGWPDTGPAVHVGPAGQPLWPVGNEPPKGLSGATALPAQPSRSLDAAFARDTRLRARSGAGAARKVVMARP